MLSSHCRVALSRPCHRAAATMLAQAAQRWQRPTLAARQRNFCVSSSAARDGSSAASFQVRQCRQKDVPAVGAVAAEAPAVGPVDREMAAELATALRRKAKARVNMRNAAATSPGRTNRQQLERWHRDRMYTCFIAQDRTTGRLLGTASLSMVAPMEAVEKLPGAVGKVHPATGAAWATVSNMAVLGAAEDVGAALLAQCERLGRRWGCNAVWLQVEPSDSAGIALYTQAGFERVRVKGSWSDIIFGPAPYHLMCKKLAPAASSAGNGRTFSAYGTSSGGSSNGSSSGSNSGGGSSSRTSSRDTGTSTAYYATDDSVDDAQYLWEWTMQRNAALDDDDWRAEHQKQQEQQGQQSRQKKDKHQQQHHEQQLAAAEDGTTGDSADKAHAAAADADIAAGAYIIEDADLFDAASADAMTAHGQQLSGSAPQLDTVIVATAVKDAFSATAIETDTSRSSYGSNDSSNPFSSWFSSITGGSDDSDSSGKSTWADSSSYGGSTDTDNSSSYSSSHNDSSSHSHTSDYTSDYSSSWSSDSNSDSDSYSSDSGDSGW